ncbi:hypothetical protein GOC74_06000 [Halomicrobium mukohataei]|uniref:Uncharacterized protein n=1 Tax=Halomicrobium mukohataei TaxID=57705 RepID=A0A847UEF7_9EURY|nr:hypothetical protein [Halomicrobium mukohataei]NLV09478.1 hypothetical protein [Halomicrobium mukohataei]
MTDDEAFDRVQAETADYSAKETFTPSEHQALKQAVFSDHFRRLVFADRSYFVLGNYDDGPKERRLTLVRDRLASRRDGAFAFLMKDIPEGWTYWTTKFKILASRADYITLVLEDSHGSHHWEAGHIDAPQYRPKVHVLKRAYEDEQTERAQFGAMIAHFVEILDRDNRVYEWQTEDELASAVDDLPP